MSVLPAASRWAHVPTGSGAKDVVPRFGPGSVTVQPGDPRHTFISPRELGMMGYPTLPPQVFVVRPPWAVPRRHSSGGQLSFSGRVEHVR